MDDAMWELGRRAIAAGWRWMPGARTENGARVVSVLIGGNVVACHEMTRYVGRLEVEISAPDFSDPATLGCLQHQVRERFATRVWIKWWCAFAPDMSGRDRSWCEAVDGMGRRLVAGPTVEHKDEVSAWLAALEAAPKVAP